MRIRGHRVTLRPITMDDLPHCVRWAADPEVMHHVIQRTLTEEEERTWLEDTLRSEHDKVFVILDEDGNPIGTCGIHLRASNPSLRDEEGISLGIMIGEKPAWGKGYGPDAMRTLADHAHRAYGAHRVWLTVDSVHARAIRAYEKAGFSIARTIAVADRVHSGGEQYVMVRRYPPPA